MSYLFWSGYGIWFCAWLYGAIRLVARSCKRTRKPVMTIAETMRPLTIAALEREAFAPLAPLIAEAERKAIAMHSPLPGGPHLAQVIPAHTMQHPFDPCHLPGCRQARSQHEHVEVIGAGSYEVTAFGDRERSFLPGPPLSGGGGFPIQIPFAARNHQERIRILRNERLRAWDACRLLVSHQHPLTDSEQNAYDMNMAVLDCIDRRLSALLKTERRRRGMPGWTNETHAALAAADWAYTRRWLKAMRAYDAGRTRREAMDAYNAVMPAARTQWDADVKDALALSEDDPF